MPPGELLRFQLPSRTRRNLSAQGLVSSFIRLYAHMGVTIGTAMQRNIK